MSMASEASTPNLASDRKARLETDDRPDAQLLLFCARKPVWVYIAMPLSLWATERASLCVLAQPHSMTGCLLA